MGDAEPSPTDFDPRNILEPDDLPLGIGLQDAVFELVGSWEAPEVHDPRGRIDSLLGTENGARCQRFHHVCFGEAVRAQTVAIQPDSDRIAAIPRSPILRILANDDLLATIPGVPEYEEADCCDGHADQEMADPGAEVWPSDHG